MAFGRDKKDSIWRTTFQRELGVVSSRATARQMQFTENLAHRLCKEATLHGHTGCVNRLAWSEDGCFLASGSDDRSLRVWRYTGDGAQRPLVVDTHHQGNIFGVRFLPQTDNRELVSGAMDYSVQHHVMEAGVGSAEPQQPAPARNGRNCAHPSSSQRSVPCRTTSYTPHKGRIKDVEVAPCNPNQFWSASEDGTIREYDKRCSTASQRDYQSSNVLLEVTNKGRPVELKSVAINKGRPHEMAVAAGDPFLRIYDRRMLSPGRPSASAGPAAEPLLKLAPPHLSSGSGPQRQSTPHATYVQFGNRGDKVVATYHGDHTYSFDTTASEQLPVAAFRAPMTNGASEERCGWLPAAAEVERGHGFQALTSGQPSVAVLHYSRALRLAPTSAVLYAKRAAALLQRGWVGDAAFALRDCECALACEPGDGEAALLQPEALLSLGHLEAALAFTEDADYAHPELGEEVARLFGRIEDAMVEKAREAEKRAATNARRQAALRGESPPSWAESPTGSESGRGDGPGSAESPPAERDAAAATENADLRTPAATAATSADRRGSDSSSGDSPGGGSDSGGSSTSGSAGSRQSRGAPGGAGADMWESPGGLRLLRRFVGHCNCATDIKEAAFLGQNDSLVACGSDDGRVFIYSAESGEVVQVLQADEDVANCVQPHPSLPILATSGIEPVIRLWSPGDSPVEEDVAKATQENQQRMQEGPQMLRGINPRVMQAFRDNPELLEVLVQRAGMDLMQLDDGEEAGGAAPVDCRVS